MVGVVFGVVFGVVLGVVAAIAIFIAIERVDIDLPASLKSQQYKTMRGVRFSVCDALRLLNQCALGAYPIWPEH